MPTFSPTSSRNRPLLLCASLLVAACTEKTVVREVPAGGDTGANAAPASAAFADGSDAPSAGAFTEDLPGVDGSSPHVTDPDTVSGAAGEIVDCTLVLPCRWLSTDSAFAVTITSGDDTASQGGLSVAFGVDALHDTEVSFGSGSEAVTANGARPTPIARALGDGNGIAALGLRAGESVEGRIDYDRAAGASSLARWRVGLVDNGFVREATFENVPLGPAESTAADCALALPCTWTSSDGAASVTLESAGGLADSRRLATGFTVVTGEDASLAFDGARAFGVDGTVFESRTHALGTNSGFETLSATTIANLPSGGTVDFRRTATAPRALSMLELALYPDAPVPRWQVVFENVPLP